MKGLWKRLLCVAVALCLMLQPVAYVQAEGETRKINDNTTYEIEAYVNPLYKDVITEDDLVYMPKKVRSSVDVEATSEETEIVAQIRQAMVDRESEFTVCYATESAYDETWLETWWEQVFDETENSHEGDYLRWTYAGRGTGTLNIKSLGDMNYYTFNAPVTYYTTKVQEKELDEKLEEVLTELGVLDSLKSDYEKTVAIYDYICSNITYDYANLKDESYVLKFTAYAALIDKTAVCQGYAVLLYRMLEEAGVDARVVTGNGGGPYAWNISKIDETYYYSDSTWDAGRAPESYKYFLKGSDEFGDHTPDEDSFVYQKPYSDLLSPVSYVPNNSGGDGIEHAWNDGEVTIPATCTEAGEKTYVCICGCGKTKTETIPATGHSWNKDYTVDKAASCTATGSKSIHCANCNATKNVTTIAKLAHKWNSGVITTKATTKKNGKLAKQCKVCKAKATETLYRAKSISLSKTKFVYNGKTQRPTVVVKDSKGKVISASNYKVKFSKGCKNAGTYKVTVTFKGQYSGKLTKSFKITKVKPTITASNFTKVKGDKAFSIKPKVSPKGGKVTYKSSNKKIATVSSKGKVTIKKAGKVTITITSASNKNCKKVTKKITVTIKPK